MYLLSSLQNGGTSAAGESLVKLNERSCQIFSQIKEKLFPVINLQAHLPNLHIDLTGRTPSHKSSHTFFLV